MASSSSSSRRIRFFFFAASGAAGAIAAAAAAASTGARPAAAGAASGRAARTSLGPGRAASGVAEGTGPGAGVVTAGAATGPSTRFSLRPSADIATAPAPIAPSAITIRSGQRQTETFRVPVPVCSTGRAPTIVSEPARGGVERATIGGAGSAAMISRTGGRITGSTGAGGCGGGWCGRGVIGGADNVGPDPLGRRGTIGCGRTWCASAAESSWVVGTVLGSGRDGDAGASAAVTGKVGGFLYTGARSDLSAAADPGRYPDHASFQAAVESAKGKQTAGILTATAGGALVTAALLRWMLHDEVEGGDEPAVMPSAGGGEDSAMLFIGGRF